MDRTEYNKIKKAVALDCSLKKDSDGVVLNPECQSRAEQAKGSQCDINKIVAKGRKTGYLGDPLAIKKTPIFGDFTNAVDFQTANNQIIKMREEFNALPASTRTKFENDPAKLLAFIEDPKNKQESIALGLIPQPVISWKKELTPEGEFWVKLEDGKEVQRAPIKPVSPAPVAPGTGE